MGGGGHDDHHGHHFSPEAIPKADQDLALLKREKVPVMNRDHCAHLLVPLNTCRRETFFNPDKCQPQRHIYEECQYIAWLARVEAKKNAAAAAAATH